MFGGEKLTEMMRVSGRMMETALNDLRAECDRTAREFLAIEGWKCPKWKVENYVKELRSSSALSSSAMGWLLRQTTTLPVQAEPARRLHELVHAITALRAEECARNTPVAAK